MNLPQWWEWELGFTAHAEIRMEERNFTEVELRMMFDSVTELIPARRPGRWLIRTRHAGSPWCVVVEPDSDEEILMIVTAYSIEVGP